MYNKTIVLGRMTATPELKKTPNGVEVTSFSIAVDRPFANQQGERVVDFLGIVAWRKTAEFVCKYFKKGDPILIDGSIQTRKYTDKNGVERNQWEIIADRVSFTGNKRNGVESGAAQEEFTEIEDDGTLPF